TGPRGHGLSRVLPTTGDSADPGPTVHIGGRNPGSRRCGPAKRGFVAGTFRRRSRRSGSEYSIRRSQLQSGGSYASKREALRSCRSAGLGQRVFKNGPLASPAGDVRFTETAELSGISGQLEAKP